MKGYVAYVGSYSYTGKAKGITIFDVDMERGSFKKRTEVEVDNASDIIVPSDRRMLYTVEDYGVVTFRILPGGGLVRVSNKKVNGVRPHHICVDQEGKYLYTSGYYDGELAILRLDPDGAVGPVMDEVYHKGLGSIAERGSRAHITCSKPARDMRFVMPADPGTDQVSIYHFMGRPGEIRLVDAIRTARDSLPYFFTFSKDSRFLYLLSDMTNAVDVYRYTVSEGRGMPEFTKLQTVCTTGDNAPDSLNAATCITFAAHGHYIFVDNAGDSSMTLFSRDTETGLPTAEFNLPISGEYPKDVAVFLDRQHIVSVDHESGTLSFFKVSYEKKLIVTNTNEIPMSQPNCCVIMSIREDA